MRPHSVQDTIFAHSFQEQAAFEKDQQGLHPNVEYSFARLIRGLASSRDAARQGFALALSEVLLRRTQYPFQFYRKSSALAVVPLYTLGIMCRYNYATQQDHGHFHFPGNLPPVGSCSGYLSDMSLGEEGSILWTTVWIYGNFTKRTSSQRERSSANRLQNGCATRW